MLAWACVWIALCLCGVPWSSLTTRALHVYTHMHAPTHTHAHTRTRTRTHAHAHTRTRAHTHAPCAEAKGDEEPFPKVDMAAVEAHLASVSDASVKLELEKLLKIYKTVASFAEQMGAATAAAGEDKEL